MSLRMDRVLLPNTRSVLESVLPSWIESIQLGTIVQVANSQTATIASVDVSRTVLIPQGWDNGGLDPDEMLGILTLTNATTVTLSFGGTGTIGTVTYAFAVVQLLPGVLRSLQYGTMSMAHPTLTTTATITAVNTSKTFLLHLGNAFGMTGRQQFRYATNALTLTNETTVTATRTVSQPTATTACGFAAVEFF